MSHENQEPTCEMPDGRPHPNTYWVDPGRLLAGEYPGSLDPELARAKLQQFLDAGVTFFVDLTEEGELESYDRWLPSAADGEGESAGQEKVVHRRHPIRDLRVPESPTAMATILDEIAGALAEGHRVYVHCWGGVGRTGMVIGCYLVRGGLDGPAALARVQRLYASMSEAKRRAHPRSPETEEQRRYVEQWAELDPAWLAKESSVGD